MRSKARVVELKVPNEMRYEKVAMMSAASVAKQMGFSDDRIADVKTAVSEAVLNAIEHSQQAEEDQKILVAFTLGESALKIDVKDRGAGFDPSKVETPRIEDKMNADARKRGWGLFLIRELVDDLDIDSADGEGMTVSMVIHLRA